MHVVGIYPEDGCGIGVDPDCTVPTNVTLAFRFDRFLDPFTASRQAIRLYTGDPATSPGPPPFEVSYDPIERVVEFRTPPGYALAPHTLYELELVVPKEPGDYGIRAFDGAPLAEAELPLHGTFFTGDAPVDSPPAAVPTCEQIMGSVFSSCTGSACHQQGGNVVGGLAVGDAPYGLWLDSPRHFTLSAVGRIAHETEDGDQSGGAPALLPLRFGVRMPLVEPRNPANSYLLYKLLVNAGNYEPCPDAADTGPCSEPADPSQSAHASLPLGKGELLTPSLAELERLNEWFVRGVPMPRPRADGVPLSVHLQGLRALTRFIAAGADCGP